MRLILVRHGETGWNRDGKYQGSKDVRLSKKGLQQAKGVAKRLKNEMIDAAYTSKRKRAIQTAQKILNFHNIKLVKTERLNERSYGKWEGLTKEEVRKKYAKNCEQYHKSSKSKFYTRPLGGKSLFDLTKKIKQFIRELTRKNKGKTILIVAHNGPLRVIIGLLMGYSKEKTASMRLQPSSLTVIDLNKTKPRLELLNCDKHAN